MRRITWYIPIQCVASALIGSLCNIAHAQDGPNLLVNPSFEQDILTPGTFKVETPSGWGLLFGTCTILTKDYAGGGVVWAPPTNGQQFLYLGDFGGPTAIFQDVNLTASTHYRLTFDEANFLSGSGVYGAKLDVDILAEGQSLFGPNNAVEFTRPPNSGYAAQELDFTSVAAGTYRLTLNQSNNYATNLDNFYLSAVASASVPEPGMHSSLAGMALLFMGQSLLRRRTSAPVSGVSDPA